MNNISHSRRVFLKIGFFKVCHPFFYYPPATTFRKLLTFALVHEGTISKHIGFVVGVGFGKIGCPIGQQR
jgi:hypothetical protein